MKQIIIFLACFLMVACKTTEQKETVTVHDTLKIVNIQKDSIYLKDSVFVNQYIIGDTVFRDVDRWHTAFKEKVRIDTVVQVRDSLVFRDRVEYKSKTPIPLQYLRTIIVGVALLLFCSWLWKATK